MKLNFFIATSLYHWHRSKRWRFPFFFLGIFFFCKATFPATRLRRLLAGRNTIFFVAAPRNITVFISSGKVLPEQIQLSVGPTSPRVGARHGTLGCAFLVSNSSILRERARQLSHPRCRNSAASCCCYSCRRRSSKRSGLLLPCVWC